MLRAALLATLLATTGRALAGPTVTKQVASPKAQRKDLPPGIAEKASEAFARGRELDEAGDLRGALAAYQQAAGIYPHPNTTYNLADVQRRLKMYKESIASFEKYLEQAGDAADRAGVEKILEDLRNTPGTLEIGATGSDEQAFVDGEPIGLLPQTLELHDGPHVIDVVTPISYGWIRCDVRMGQKEVCKPNPVPRMDGNVVISGSRRLEGQKRWRETGTLLSTRERLEVRHGHYSISDLIYKQCKTFDIDIAKGENVVTFIFVTLNEDRPKGQDECDPIIGVKTHVLKF